MIVLQQTEQEQTFICIPRAYETEVTINLYDETRNTTAVITPTIDVVGDYYYVSAIFDLKQDNFYVLSIIYGETEIFKDKVFCTNQNVDNYSINAGVYIEQPDADNEYITI
jgi:hypothetical protein